jgi:hypothetical protein
VLAPISYVGKSRKSENARVMYGLVVELDNLLVGKDGTQKGLKNLIGQWSEKTHWIPKPTYTVASGNGLHLYYLFEQGIPLFPNVVKELQAYKRELTKMIWNRHTTVDYKEENIQFESIFQAFRMVGTITKKGDRVHAFRTGERVSIEYMNSFILAETKKKHPETQITMATVLLFIGLAKLVSFYAEDYADNLSLGVALVSLSASIFFAEEIRAIVPINLLLLLIITHVLYVGVRWYIKGYRENRGY